MGGIKYPRTSHFPVTPKIFSLLLSVFFLRVQELDLKNSQQRQCYPTTLSYFLQESGHDFDHIENPKVGITWDFLRFPNLKAN